MAKKKKKAAKKSSGINNRKERRVDRKVRPNKKVDLSEPAPKLDKDEIAICNSAIDDGQLNYSPGEEFEGDDDCRRTLVASGAVTVHKKKDYE